MMLERLQRQSTLLVPIFLIYVTVLFCLLFLLSLLLFLQLLLFFEVSLLEFLLHILRNLHLHQVLHPLRWFITDQHLDRKDEGKKEIQLSSRWRISPFINLTPG